MRAAVFLRGLAQRYRVSLLVVPLYRPPGTAPDAEIAALCEHIMEIPIQTREEVVSPLTLMVQSGSITPSLHSLLADTETSADTMFGDTTFDVVHVFRLNAVPFVRAYLEMSRPRPRFQLDLDDIESLATERLAEIYRLNNDRPTALFHRLFARRLYSLESECFRRFDRVIVCSENDRARLQARSHVEISVIPNAVHVPGDLPRSSPHEPFAFLFVGTLGYYPNIDALDFFITRVVPLIHKRTPLPFVINIVGSGSLGTVSYLAQRSEVRLIGTVPDVRPWYEASDVAIVPIRAGGGTRIKILEAFAHRLPVVSTEIGIEGIEARDEEHALLGNTAERFADHCAHLMTDSDLRTRLSARAFSLLKTSYSDQAVLQRIAAEL